MPASKYRETTHGQEETDDHPGIDQHGGQGSRQKVDGGGAVSHRSQGGKEAMEEAERRRIEVTISEACREGVMRLRRPMWANPNAYMTITLIRQGDKLFYGPWSNLYDRRCQEAIGEPTPQKFLNVGDTTDDYVAYTGPLDPQDHEPVRIEMGGTK
jgi:hypothetical protein